MITLLGRDTCKPAYIPEKHIDHMEEFVEEIAGRAYPYTRIYIKNPSDGYEYYVDVVESQKKIEKVIAEKAKEDSNVKTKQTK